MYADVACSTGWTWEYIGQYMTLPRLAAMHDHWRRFPPVHVTAALFAGIGTRSATTGTKAANDEADESTASYVSSMPIQKMRLPS